MTVWWKGIERRKKECEWIKIWKRCMNSYILTPYPLFEWMADRFIRMNHGKRGARGKNRFKQNRTRLNPELFSGNVCVCVCVLWIYFYDIAKIFHIIVYSFVSPSSGAFIFSGVKKTCVRLGVLRLDWIDAFVQENWTNTKKKTKAL